MNIKKIEQAKQVAQYLYRGDQTQHRSCAVSLAETFCVPVKTYQGLRRGGVLGDLECGAVLGGRLILAEILGDPDPLAPVSKELFEGMHLYKTLIQERLQKGKSRTLVCNDLSGQFDFESEERKNFCTCNVAVVAEVVAEVLEQLEQDYKVKEIKTSNE